MRGFSAHMEEPFDGAPEACPVSVGDTFSRKPAAFSCEDWFGPVKLVWTVVYVNAAHRYYTAEAVRHGHRIRESFKF